MNHWLITGANRGIGLELCRRIHGRGDRVIAVCRTVSAELEALGVRIETGVELTSEPAIADLAERLGKLPLAGAILNAGILESDQLESLDAESIRRQFEVNALAPLLLAAPCCPTCPPVRSWR
jgi:NAD(P)-dependent dehydrogenase (short-subunit alcohol dehydrogenase family)